jgi:hypothetical protein
VTGAAGRTTFLESHFLLQLPYSFHGIYQFNPFLHELNILLPIKSPMHGMMTIPNWTFIVHIVELSIILFILPFQIDCAIGKSAIPKMCVMGSEIVNKHSK